MDPIADMLTQIRNAQAVGKERIEVPHSKVKEALAKLLLKEGYLAAVKVFKPRGKPFKKLSLELKYFEGGPFISHIKRISTPGRRVYVRKEALPSVLGGYGLVIVSTSRGLMSAKEARKRNLGGELVCEVW